MKRMNKLDEFLEHIKKTKSNNTASTYKSGLMHFIEWYGKNADTILEEQKKYVVSEDAEKRKYFGYKVDEYFRSLVNQEYTKNSARVLCNGITAFFEYYGFPIKLSKETTKVIITEKTYTPSIEEWRSMYALSDIKGKVYISLALDVPLRVNDFVAIRKDQINLEKDAPIEFSMISGKEDVLIKTFISENTKELLKAFVPTLKTENEYIFQNGNGSHLTDQALNILLKNLGEKAKIAIPKGMRLTHHAFRKTVYSECADKHVSVHIADILTGKQVPKDKLTYLSRIDLKKAFLEIHETLNLTNGHMKSTLETKDAQIEQLKAQNEDLKRRIDTLASLLKKEIAEEVIKQNLTVARKSGKVSTPQENLDALVQQRERQEKEEYAKRIDNGNGD